MGLRRSKEAPRAAASRVQTGSAVFGRHFIFMGVPENHKINACQICPHLFFVMYHVKAEAGDLKFPFFWQYLRQFPVRIAAYGIDGRDLF